MSRPSLLPEADITQLVASLDDWQWEGDALVAHFAFANFVEAFAFMTACADVSEELDHHPEWSNVYNRVEVRLTTHDAGGITALDVAWASRASVLASRAS